ncbi:MAG: 4-alpha-glucanotransferase, partial [Chloroflexota bacterium]
WTYDLKRLPLTKMSEVEGMRYGVQKVALPVALPYGYHRLTMEIDGRCFETLIISAPRKADVTALGEGSKAWGVFLPLYALHSHGSIGDFSELERLMEWVTGLGGSVVATLPLLSSSLDNPFEPSPYSPASRLFWNELYIDVTAAHKLERCNSAKTLLDSVQIREQIEALRSAPLFDYRRHMTLKRKVLEELQRCFFTQEPEGCSAFLRFTETHPEAEEYARFRATGERQRAPWPAWPAQLRDGPLKPGDYDENARDYHLYVQWLADDQVRRLSNRAGDLGSRLALDLPLGVPLHSYDVWRNRNTFALGVSMGAPPDLFFTKGQDWGLSPIHPERSREEGHSYHIACLRHHLKYAGLLRIDHVMGLHRLFWVPSGLSPEHGVYVRYPAEELYAILNVESQRHGASVVGENLGTVPSHINRTLAEHNIQRMYVLQYEAKPDPIKVLRPVPANSVASLNTHDMPTFAAFWHELDVEDRLKLGLLDERGAEIERRNRQDIKKAMLTFLRHEGWLKDESATASHVLKACLYHLAASPARDLLINLEDLWLETEPQNTPGTSEERPNWQRKARYGLEDFCHMPRLLDILKEIDHLRKRKRGPR